MINDDCFAYDSKTRDCTILKDLDCETCAFYKQMSEIKNNIFYPESFENEKLYRAHLRKYSKIILNGEEDNDE